MKKLRISRFGKFLIYTIGWKGVGGGSSLQNLKTQHPIISFFMFLSVKSENIASFTIFLGSLHSNQHPKQKIFSKKKSGSFFLNVFKR